MFEKKSEIWRGEQVTRLTGLGSFRLCDTLECGQAFRYERLVSEDGYDEYLTVDRGRLLRLGQDKVGELIVFSDDEDTVERAAAYFDLYTDYDAIRRDVAARSDSPHLARAAEAAGGIFILNQDAWETLFSFIVSQNNNIPRIRKILRAIASEYGENLAISERLPHCPKENGLENPSAPSPEKCRGCGICYSFPTPEDILSRPEGLLPSKPGFRYKYLIDAASRVHSGDCDLEKIKAGSDSAYALAELKKILGVGDKVASCVALFGLGMLDAFPVDVWMRRAIDVYFDGELDPTSLGPYAGVAQQYIFHYIRNIEG